MSENQQEFYLPNIKLEHQDFLNKQNIENNSTMRSNGQTQFHSYYPNHPSQTQVHCFTQNYNFGADTQEISFPCMTPPYQDINSTSEDFSTYCLPAFESKYSASTNHTLHQNPNNVPYAANGYNNDPYNTTNSYVSIQGRVNECGNYLEQPLTPPLDDCLEQGISCKVESKNFLSQNVESTFRETHDSNSSNKPLSKWKRKQERERLMLPLHVRQKRRLAANARERKRMTSLNEAFTRLRAILPTRKQESCSLSLDNVQSCETSSAENSKELSKMEALQMAQAYIAQLSKLLES